MKQIGIGIIFLFYSTLISAQFKGKGGVYYLGTADIPINQTNFTNNNISGVVVRFTWGNLETSPNQFNWTFIDGEIAKAKSTNKKISLQVLGIPNWVLSSAKTKYFYIDKNTFSTTFGKTLTAVVPWDSFYVERYKNLLNQLSIKYATDSTITYINAVGVAFSRGLPDTIITDTNLLTKQPFWTTYNYHADTLGALMNKITDYYMEHFPNTPLWCSVDYVLFEPNASGLARNYLATIYCNHGISKYPDRFGLFREDISPCNPPTISTGSQWYIMKQNPCRTGAQMLWSVQDGPTRMNACGILPNTKTVVLDSAVNKGLSLGMRYLEIYGSDISDNSLISSIETANIKLKEKETECTVTAGLNTKKEFNRISIFPNPVKDFLYLNSITNKPNSYKYILQNIEGQILIEAQNTSIIDFTNIETGIYFLNVLESDSRKITIKILKE